MKDIWTKPKRVGSRVEDGGMSWGENGEIVLEQ